MSDVVWCEKKDCFANENGMCNALAKRTEKECPFYKTMVQMVLENGALTQVPKPDWESYRRHAETNPPTIKDITAWLYEFEELIPTDDPVVATKLFQLFRGSDEYIPKKVAKAKITDWLQTHPEGCGWAMSPEETAERILEREPNDDEERTSDSL